MDLNRIQRDLLMAVYNHDVLFACDPGGENAEYFDTHTRQVLGRVDMRDLITAGLVKPCPGSLIASGCRRHTVGITPNGMRALGMTMSLKDRR